MKDLRITEKTKVIKNEIENYQKILAKYRKQKTKAITKQKELQKTMNACDNWNTEEYKQAVENYRKAEKKVTRLEFFVKTCEGYRKAWLELYAFNILKDNKDIIAQPLYYKREQARLFKYFDFEGLKFVVNSTDILSYHRGLTMYDEHASRYEGRELLTDEYLNDLTLMTDNNLRYRWQQRYLHFENFEKFVNDKYKQIIKIAKKSQKYIDIIKEDQEKLGDHFKYDVAGLTLDSYAKDWQKYGRF